MSWPWEEHRSWTPWLRSVWPEVPWGGHDGALIDDKHVNLNLPKVVAALLQAARQLPQPPPRQTLEFDGFALWRMRSREEP